MYLRRLYFLLKEVCEIILTFKESYNFIKRYKYEYLLLKEFTCSMNSRFSIATSRDKYSTPLCTRHETDNMFGNLRLSYWLIQPFHFNKIDMTLYLDHTINLFDNALTVVSDKMKGFMNKNSIGMK